MSSALARAATAAKSTRILRRDERKPVDDAVRGSGINKVGTKEVVKNPTRVVPDLPGFHQLTKLETIRDTRDIDKRSNLMNMNETDSEDELENAVPVTMRPPCNSESLIHKKKKRLNAWVSDPTLADKEVDNTKKAANALRGELDRILEETEQWCRSFEIGRAGLTQSIVASRAEASKLERDTNLLQNLTAAECGSTRKRRTVTAKEAATELYERKVALEDCLAEYVKLCKEAKGDKVPMVTIEIEEGGSGSGSKKGKAAASLMNLPQDKESFKKLHGLTDYREQQVAAAVAAASAAAASSRTDSTSSSSSTISPASADDATTTTAATAATATASRVVSPLPGDVDAGLNKVDISYSLEMDRGGELLSDETQARLANEATSVDMTTTTTGGGNKEGEERDASTTGAKSSSRSGKARQQGVGGGEKRSSSSSSSKRVAKGDSKSKADKDKEGQQVEEGKEDDEDAEIRTILDLFTAAEDAIANAHNQIGDIDVFFDNLDVDGGGVPGTSLARGTSSESHRGPSAVDRGSNPAFIQECLLDSKALIEDNAVIAPRAEMFRAKYAQGERGWMRYIAEQTNGPESGAGPGGAASRKRRRLPTSVIVKSYAYPRTPRGLPLLVSPLSQYEDKYAGSVIGGPKASNLYNGDIPHGVSSWTLPRTADITPAALVHEENKVMTHALLQSASASSETKLRRLRTLLSDWRRQEEDVQLLYDRAVHNNDSALREDVIECKRIRRELQTFGIASTPLKLDTPLSPIAETSGWGAYGAGGGGSSVVNSNTTGSINSSQMSDKEKKRASKNFGMGRGRSSGSMAALQKGNSRKSKHEWRGPPRNPKEAAAAAAAQVAAAERAAMKDKDKGVKKDGGGSGSGSGSGSGEAEEREKDRASSDGDNGEGMDVE